MNFEFSYNTKRWDATRFTSEIRPIIGWHLKPVDIIVNPIFDTAYDGINKNWTSRRPSGWPTTSRRSGPWPRGYADDGPGARHQTDTRSIASGVRRGGRCNKAVSIDAGVGIGLTGSSDKLTLKLSVSRDLNHGADGWSREGSHHVVAPIAHRLPDARASEAHGRLPRGRPSRRPPGPAWRRRSRASSPRSPGRPATQSAWPILMACTVHMHRHWR